MQFFGTYQEFNAIKSALSIQKLLKIKAKTLRDGMEVEINSEDLVIRRYCAIRVRR